MVTELQSSKKWHRCQRMERQIYSFSNWGSIHKSALMNYWDFTGGLEKAIGTPLQYLAWKIPGRGEPGGLLSMGLHRVGHDWSNLAALVIQGLRRRTFMAGGKDSIPDQGTKIHVAWWGRGKIIEQTVHKVINREKNIVRPRTSFFPQQALPSELH